MLEQFDSRAYALGCATTYINTQEDQRTSCAIKNPCCATRPPNRSASQKCTGTCHPLITQVRRLEACAAPYASGHLFVLLKYILDGLDRYCCCRCGGPSFWNYPRACSLRLNIPHWGHPIRSGYALAQKHVQCPYCNFMVSNPMRHPMRRRIFSHPAKLRPWTRIID